MKKRVDSNSSRPPEHDGIIGFYMRPLVIELFEFLCFLKKKLEKLVDSNSSRPPQHDAIIGFYMRLLVIELFEFLIPKITNLKQLT